ncbi:ATP-binding protein [Agrobacterium pusense]|jgi:hypothetical protein|uniref:ATP-binding protein n=1 Tax=Agrobacterium pusense TaxID=648995 RepID=UPI002452D645|nr:ATP-binding protein [Agrobacterium pusense]
MAKALKANGNPTKAFFVDMITRDISLEDCILDLIDNSIDGAWRLEGGRPTNLDSEADLSPYHIEIIATPDEFSISDNCGGMTLHDARTYAFTFGRTEDDDYEQFSIGVYGIGMKRAVFKIGRSIKVRSTVMEDGDSALTAFTVNIDVMEWIGRTDKKDWDFKISRDKPKKDAGVVVDVDELTPIATSYFSSPAFLNRLRRTIARDYTLQLRHGLKISLNGKPIKGWNVELLESEEIAPARLTYDDGAGKDKVVVEIVAGMASIPPDDDDDAADDTEKENPFGWYVVCNGRVVLAADKSANTVWGVDGAQVWHNQYNGFIGLVLFSAENAASLPLTTTKRNVDLGSEVYRRARSGMRRLTKDWIEYTNARKGSLEEAKDRELKAKPIPLQTLRLREVASFPKVIQLVVKDPTASISYSVPLKRYNELAAALGNINMKRKDLGLKTFEIVYDEEVGK